MDSQRQKKVSTLIKKDIGAIIDSVLRNRVFQGVLVSVTKVKGIYQQMFHPKA